ncbi:MAG: hypothetical protein RR327_02710 [Clostridia bacterium]
MERKVFINKVSITAEAKFDYCDCVEDCKMPTTSLRNELESYINYMQQSGKLCHCNYFHATYFDETTSKTLMLFVYKGERFGNMQLWKLVGVSDAVDYSKALDDDGIIRNWLNSKVENLTEQGDWVTEFRVWQTEQQQLQKESNE